MKERAGLTPDEYDRWLASLTPPPKPPAQEHVWTLVRRQDRAEMIRRRFNDGSGGCELALFVNGEFLRARHFRGDDSAGAQTFLAQERAALEREGWTAIDR